MANNLKKDYSARTTQVAELSPELSESGVRPRPWPCLHGKGANGKRFSHPAQNGDGSWGIQRLP